MSLTPKPDPDNAGAGSEAITMWETRVGESFFVAFKGRSSCVISRNCDDDRRE